jgi:hypothetical protein
MAVPVDARLYLGRYLERHLISSNRAFQTFAARTLDDRRCVVVVPQDGLTPELASNTFREVDEAHSRLSHPLVPVVQWRGTAHGVPCLELACDAVADGFTIVRHLAEIDEKIPFGAADAFISSLREAMECAHASSLCLGRLSLGNLLFSPDGRWSLVGFGRNYPVEQEDGGPDASITHFQAPELSTGGAPSPTGDYVALLLFTRSLMSFIDMSPVLGGVMRGEPQPNGLALLEALQWVDRHVIIAEPSKRVSITEAVAVADRIRQLAGVSLDPDGFAAFMSRLLCRLQRPAASSEAVTAEPLTVHVGPDAAWVAGPDGERHHLGRALRQIMVALVEHHRSRPHSALNVDELLQAGWPGERPAFEAGANRVYVALSRLRSMGLRDAIERFDDGYRIPAQVRVRIAEDRNTAAAPI